MKLTETADHIIKALLLLSIIVFAIALLLHGLLLLGVGVPLPKEIVPDTLLATLVGPLTVITVFELVRLAVSVQDSLVKYIRVLFQVVTVILLGTLLKSFGELPLRDVRLDMLVEPALLLAASFALYGMIEFLERLEIQYLKDGRRELTPRLIPYRTGLAWMLLVYVIGFSSYTAVAILIGLPGVGFGDEYQRLVFSGFVIANVFTLLIALFFVKTYETLFEFFALVLASVMVLFALPLETVPKLVIIFTALVFAIATLSLQGFARSPESDGGSEI